jgi:hypothetical protein
MTDLYDIDTTGWTFDDFRANRLKILIERVQPGDELGYRRAKNQYERQAQTWFELAAERSDWLKREPESVIREYWKNTEDYWVGKYMPPDITAQAREIMEAAALEDQQLSEEKAEKE